MTFKLMNLWMQKLRFIVLKKIDKLFKLGFVKTSYGVNLKANFDDATFKYAFCGSYGHYFSGYLKSYNEQFLFLDIGANQGLYSVIAAKNRFCKQVVALEPVGSTADLLATNMNYCNTKTSFLLLRYALSNADSQIKLQFNAGHSGRFTITDGITNEENTKLNYEVIETKTASELNDILSDFKLKIICKIDVEGHEQIVLDELERFGIVEKCASVMIEVNESRLDPVKLDTFFLRKGFTKVKIGSGIHYDCHYIRALQASR